MGRIESCVKKISDIRFEPMPSNRVITDVAKAVCINGAAYVMTKTARILTNCDLGRNALYTGTASDYHGIRALRSFGVITAAEQKRHGEHKRRCDANYARYRAVNHAATEFEAAGIKLTSKQKEKLQTMKDTIDLDDLPYFVRIVAKKADAAAAKVAVGSKA